jgi:Ca2+-dependent lipid-binding protein
MGELQISIIEGKNFDKKDLFSDNDAFVELYLDDKKEKTKVEHNCKTPHWNQTFILYVLFIWN